MHLSAYTGYPPPPVRRLSDQAGYVGATKRALRGDPFSMVERTRPQAHDTRCRADDEIGWAQVGLYECGRLLGRCQPDLLEGDDGGEQAGCGGPAGERAAEFDGVE
jgi:hypothetical protein